MKKTFLALALIAAFTGNAFALADTAASATGGAGGAGGTASGGAATGGAGGASTVSGTSSAAGGAAQSSSASGASSATTGNTTVGTTSNVSVGGTSVGINYYTPDVSTINSTNSYSGSTYGKSDLNINQTSSGTVTNVNKTEISGTTTLKNTPDVSVGGPASGPCNGFSATFGVTVPGLGLGGGTSTVDAGCARRETARVAGMLGRMDIANAILENDPIVIEAMKAKTETVSKQVEATQMKEQQRLAAIVLDRKKTMANTSDTFHFTGAQTQGDEKTDQEIMAEKTVEIPVYSGSDPLVRARLGMKAL